jgi:hypothetical protein
MYGVSCERPVAECKCDKPGQTGSGNNSFSCTQLGQTATDFCSTEDIPCNNDTNSTLQGGDGTANKIFSGAPLHGITCIAAPDKPLPPPPSPPCKNGAWKDGQCTAMITAFGDLGTSPVDFIQKLFGILLSISGGIALLLIIKAGYMLMTSEGKPEQVQAGRDQLIAAIVGLLFLIFSLVFLQVIGFDILKIPGFSGGTAPAGTMPVGTACNANGNSQCAGGLTCVTTGGGPGGVCQAVSGSSCDANGNTPCASGFSCVTTGGRTGTCKANLNASCDVATNDCPPGQTCQSASGGRSGTCK